MAPPEQKPPEQAPPKPSEPQAVIERVKTHPEFISLGALGETVQLTAVAQDENGAPVAGVGFVWASSNPAAISVSASGLVTARANGGAEISATSIATSGPGVKGSSEARVKQMIAAVVMTPETWPTNEVWVGARRQFSAHAVDASGNEMPGAPIEWSVSNASRARVDETGLVTVLGVGANTRVTAAVVGLNDSVSFTANPEGSDVPGYMYTAWFARTDETPAVLYDGRLAYSETYYDSEPTNPNDLPWANGFASPWPHNTIEKFQYQGNRIGLLTDVANGVGTFRVIDRRRDWSILALGNAQDFALEGNRIGVLLENGEFRVKDGISGAWGILASSGVTQFQLDGNRIGIVHEDGTARAKNGISGTWELLDARDVTQLQLEGDRIGVLTAAGELRVKDGLGSAFTDLAVSGARQFALEDNRIALLLEDGRFQVMDGIHGAWTELASEPIRDFVLEGNLIGILFEDGRFQVKNGVNGAWRVFATAGVRAIQIQGFRIGAVMNDNPLSSAGVLRIWPNINASSADTMGLTDTASVMQFKLIVDNPVAPFRTTTAGFNAGQARCDRLYWTPGCFADMAPRLPAPFYGLFCGLNRPQGNEMGAAIRSEADGGYGGPIDAMDAMCLHHDVAGSWYADFNSGDYNVTQSCVVKYGLRYGTLTYNGDVIANGSSSQAVWDAAWERANMENLMEALNGYFTFTADCSDADLARFDAETDGSH